MFKRSRVLVFLCCSFCFVDVFFGRAAGPEDAPSATPQQNFQDVVAKAKKLLTTKEGREYNAVFTRAIKLPIFQAIDAAVADIKAPAKFRMVFVLGADGKILKALYSMNSPMISQVVFTLKDCQAPPLPHGDWPALFDIDIY